MTARGVGDVYEIRVRGQLDQSWAELFDGVTVSPAHGEPPTTLLTCKVADQSALHGILARIHNLNLALVSLHQAGTGQASGSGTKKRGGQE